MPRPARRTRAVVRTKEPETEAVAVEVVEVTATPGMAVVETAAETAEATETEATNTSPPAPRRSRRSDAASASQTPITGSRRTSARHAAVASAASSAAKSAKAKPKPTSKAPTPRLARGPDASGLDIMDDTFADIDTNFGDHTLGDLSDLENLENFDNLEDTDAGLSPAAAATADTTAASTSSFNVGLFRRGRPRQSSVHSRDDAPIRPSSRGGNSSAATPGSSFSLGTFKRRAREPSILGRHRRTRDDSRASRGTSRGPSRDASREPSRMHSRHTSRDRGADSESELDNTAVTAPQYHSDAESSLSNALLNTRRAARSTRSRAGLRAANVAADVSVASSANTTSMLLMGRTRTRAAAEPKAKPATTTTTTSRKRKSQDGQREDELPKRRSRGAEAEMEVDAEAEVADAVEAAEAEMEVVTETPAEPMSDISIVPSVEAPEDAVALSSPLSSPASSASVRLSAAELRRRYTTPGGPNDEIMAPPMSSDSESETPAAWPTLKGLTKGVRRGKTCAPVPMLSRQTPDLVDDEIASDISSPPSLTHSPNYRAAPVKKTRGRTAPVRGPKEKDVASLTTAALTALLPQRHRRARPQRADSHNDNDEENEFERSALLSEDDDELAHHSRANLRRGRSVSGLRASSQTQARNDKNKKRRRTYGRMSDKENDDHQDSVEAEAVDDSTFTPGETVAEDDTLPSRPARSFGDELDKAALKFKEVDKWSLEYESVVRSSSPVDAR